MDPYYDITYEVPKRIDSSIPDLTSRVTMHTLNTARHILHEDGRLLFLLPYHERVFWTNIKYVCHGTDDPHFLLCCCSYLGTIILYAAYGIG